MRTIHRHYVDQFLQANISLLGETFIDLGGERNHSRSGVQFQSFQDRTIVNIDASVAPDFELDIHDLPFENCKFSGFILAEVLEHLEHPTKALEEAYRITRPGGVGLITVPFLYGVHSDPLDFQRWTQSKLLRELGKVGFLDISIAPLSGELAVHHTLAWSMAYKKRQAGSRFAGVAMSLLRAIRPVVHFLDQSIGPDSSVTTGWCAIARKSL